MKRSDALAPLSRDHHQALMVAMVMRRADADSAPAAFARFESFWARHGSTHFDVEEAELTGALPASDEEWARGCERMAVEHARMRALAQRLAPDDVAGLAELGALLHDHVRFEERELFPYLEEHLDPAALEDLGRRIAIRERDC